MRRCFSPPVPDRLAGVDEGHRAVERVAEGDGAGVDAEVVIDGGGDVLGLRGRSTTYSPRGGAADAWPIFMRPRRSAR